jgi:hypothetical protein
MASKTPTGWTKIDTYTCRGTIDEDTDGVPTGKHIRLFDGRFDTGWRIEKFELRPANVSDDASVTVNLVGKLQTTSWGGVPVRYDKWHFGDMREIAWAACSFDSNSNYTPPMSLVDAENLIIEDMWVMINSYADANPANYYIEMTKYKIPKKLAILAMVKNLSMSKRLPL